MSQLPEIPASAYTPEMNILGMIPDILIFEGERVLVNRNALTPGTRPLQLLPLPGTEFPSRHSGRSCVTQMFLCEQLRDATILREQLRHATVRSVTNSSASESFESASFACIENRLVSALPSTVASCNCSVEEQFRDATVRQGYIAWNSCVAQLLRLKKPVFPAAAVAAALKGGGSRYRRRRQWLQSPVNTHFFEAHKACFSRTVDSPAGPEAILELHRKYANMVLKTSGTSRGSRKWFRNIFWRFGAPGKASGAKKSAELPNPGRRSGPPNPGGPAAETVDLGKARAGGSSTDASAFWDLLDPPMRSRVVATGFGDYTAGLRHTQPRFPPAMRYALMERWNDCTHLFIFGFGELTLTPVDYTAITGLGFDGPVAPLDAQYQTAALGAELVRTLLGVPTRTRYTA
ncbi:hypothetical protein JCGZ_03204 [Jatropha curcas]|uniref:Aminotransferase-like plant mobile domain-containing protein n=1 Tax=Jatropha curcas TaxID=180498 RepID=A0A067JQZ1_JATCU|nr:hypothetical protein JCGZ_03204 [Jatropha curcas]